VTFEKTPNRMRCADLDLIRTNTQFPETTLTMPHFEIIGIYAIDAHEPCHLVELSVEPDETSYSLSEISFPTRVNMVRSVQAPYDEHFLSEDGDVILGNSTYAWENPDFWRTPHRVSFFMFYLEPGKNIHTPQGLLPIPAAKVLPERLKTIEFTWPP
jgi:hypothetical protein